MISQELPVGDSMPELLGFNWLGLILLPSGTYCQGKPHF